MIAGLILSAALGLTFVDVDLPGVRVGEVHPLNGVADVNFRHVDLNGDGAPDLLLPDVAFLQRDGVLDAKVGVPLPHREAGPYCDVWQAALYLRLSASLAVVAWRDGGWETVAEQDVAWPLAAEPATDDPDDGDTAVGVRFERFLHDFDSDGTPEILVPVRDGLHVYARGPDGYAPVARLDVFPPLAADLEGGGVLWPPEERRMVLPVRQTRCRFFVHGTAIRVLTVRDLPGRGLEYAEMRHDIAPEDGYAVETTGPVFTRPMPNHVRPCRLNADEAIDYAGGDWALSEASALPTPVYETFVALGGAGRPQRIRTRSFRPRCSFVDFDGDGDLDLVAESTGLFDGGMRETVGRFMTGRELAHEVHVRFQDARRRFSTTPDLVGRFTIVLDAPPCRNTLRFRRYLAGELVDVTGDFNGDGYRDALVRERMDRASVYLGTGHGFSRSPDAVLSVSEGAAIGVADVNGDGLSDLVIPRTMRRGDPGALSPRVLIAQEDDE